MVPRVLGVVPRALGVVPRVLGVVPRVLGVVPRVLGVVPRVLGAGPQGTRPPWLDQAGRGDEGERPIPTCPISKSYTGPLGVSTQKKLPQRPAIEN